MRCTSHLCSAIDAPVVEDDGDGGHGLEPHGRQHGVQHTEAVVVRGQRDVEVDRARAATRPQGRPGGGESGLDQHLSDAASALPEWDGVGVMFVVLGCAAASDDGRGLAVVCGWLCLMPSTRYWRRRHRYYDVGVSATLVLLLVIWIWWWW